LAKQLIGSNPQRERGLERSGPDVLVVELAESSVNIRARWWINPPRRADALTRGTKSSLRLSKSYMSNTVLTCPIRPDRFCSTTKPRKQMVIARSSEGWPAGNKKVPQPQHQWFAEEVGPDAGAKKWL